MKFEKIYLARFCIITILIGLITALIDCLTTQYGNGIGIISQLLMTVALLIIYIILLAFSFSFIGKNNPYTLLVISITPVFIFLYLLI
jgi:hypothetical protein